MSFINIIITSHVIIFRLSIVMMTNIICKTDKIIETGDQSIWIFDKILIVVYIAINNIIPI
jgi:hypothetical protein